MPWTWPARTGSPRSRAQRRLPSAMMATCRGPSASDTSDLQDLGFLAVRAAVDRLDVAVGEPLQVLELAPFLVLGQVAVAQRLLQVVGRLASMVSNLDARLLGAPADLLHHLATAFLGEIGRA